jgi:hypothetical protein
LIPLLNLTRFWMQRRFKIDDRLQTSALGRSWLQELKVTFCIDWFVLAKMSCRWRLRMCCARQLTDVAICVDVWLEKPTISAVNLTLCSDGAAAWIDEIMVRVAAARVRCALRLFLSLASLRGHTCFN